MKHPWKMHKHSFAELIAGNLFASQYVFRSAVASHLEVLRYESAPEGVTAEPAANYSLYLESSCLYFSQFAKN